VSRLTAFGPSGLPLRRGLLVRSDGQPPGAGEHASPPRPPQETQKRLLTPFLLVGNSERSDEDSTDLRGLGKGQRQAHFRNARAECQCDNIPRVYEVRREQVIARKSSRTSSTATQGLARPGSRPSEGPRERRGEQTNGSVPPLLVL
jgi:hypothetical protein